MDPDKIWVPEFLSVSRPCVFVVLNVSGKPDAIKQCREPFICTIGTSQSGLWTVTDFQFGSINTRIGRSSAWAFRSGYCFLTDLSSDPALVPGTIYFKLSIRDLGLTLWLPLNRCW